MRTVIFLLLSPTLLIAQQWTRIGPTPAAVSAIAIDPRGSGVVCIGTMGGGILKSGDNGNTWAAVNNGFVNLEVSGVAIDASGPQTAYAGSNPGLYKTSDGGQTWQNLPAITGSITAVTADPKQSGVVYAGAFSNLANGAIRKTIDGGATWATILPTTAAIFNIAIDPENTDILYAPTIGHGAFKTSDGGKTWSPMGSLTPAAVWMITIDPADSNVLYAATNEDGVWRSTDAGSTWQQSGSPGPFPVYSLAADASAHVVYAGTNGGGFWASSDGGATWQPTAIADGMVFAIAVDPAGTVYAGTNGAGAQVSHDFGASWSVMNTGLDGFTRPGYGVWIDPGNGQKIMIGFEAPIGVIETQDSGGSWTFAGQGFTGMASRGIAFDPTESRRIYVGGMVGSAFFKSIDGGWTWSRRKFGTPAVYVIGVSVDPVNPNTVYASTQNEGLFKSTDYGDTWSAAGGGLSGAITFLTPDPITSGRLFASTATAFYLSEDGGATWTNILNMPAWTMTVDRQAPSTVYATTRTQGVFRSLDAGHTWQAINTGITVLSMGRTAAVIVDPTDRQTLYVGSEGGGVYNSSDGGDHWTAMNAGLDDLTVDGLAMDPSNPALLYAGGPSGVYRFQASDQSVR
jgi:photosystem II stability/assembly factor-like uncharacterized protein